MPGTDSYYPGTQIIEKPFQPSRSQAAEVLPQASFIGVMPQGPTTPTPVSTWSQFASLFGTATYTDTHYAVSDFFSNGGRLAYVTRLANTSAASATVTVPALPGPGTLFTFLAKSGGVWGNDLKAVITFRVAGRFDIALYKVPTGVTFSVSNRNSAYLVENWIDLSMYTSDARYYQDIINAPSNSASAYVTVSGQSNVVDMPVTAGSLQFNFASGSAGTALTTTAGVTGGDYLAYKAAIDALGVIQGPFVLNLPNVMQSSVNNGALINKYAVDYAVTRGSVFVVIDPKSAQTPGDMQTFVNTTLALSTDQGSYAAVYYPWVYGPGIASAVGGKSSLRPPGGAVAGIMAAVDSTYGVWRAPAGPQMRINGGVAIERTFTDADLTLMNNENVNVIRDVPGSGVVIMGARTLKKTGLDMYVNNRRSVQYLRESLKRVTEYALFSPNDERLWADLEAACSRELGKFWQTGGLKGSTSMEAYYVKCDATNNVPSTSAGQTNIEVGIALAMPAEFIVITISHYDGTSAASSSL